MADPTLMIGYDELLEEIRTFLGFSATLSAADTAICERAIQKGLSAFYRAYPWTFSHPVAHITVGTAITGTVSGLPVYSSSTELSTVTLTTAIAEEKMVGESFSFDTSEETYLVRSVTDTTTVVVEGDASSETTDDTFSIRVAAFDLPDNFGSVDGNILYHRSGSGYVPVVVVAERQLHESRQNNYTGVPRYAAIRSKSTDLSAMQKKEVVFYPTPDAEYTLTYNYTLLNDMLAAGEYPLGDSRHRGTIIEACLAAAEQQEDDELGMHTSLFQQSLHQSVLIDGENEPSLIGYNSDLSDGLSGYPEYNEAEKARGHYYSAKSAPSYG